MRNRSLRLAACALACLSLLPLPAAAGLRVSPQAILRLFKRQPKPVAAPADTMPPRWRPAGQRTLEDSLLVLRLRPLGPESAALRVASDPRQLRVRVDPDSGTLSYGVQAGEVPLVPAASTPLGDYTQELTRSNFRRQWQQTSRERLNVQAAGAAPARTSGIQIKAPFELPRQVQGLLGPGGPALNVSGSERISLAGTSDWSNRPTVLGQRASLFPSLDMRQDLDIRLEGQLSDRVKVNLLQSSFNQVPLANKIAINYQGDEEDVVQALNLGNTNLSLPGTQFVSYSGRNEGLFGAKTALRLGPLDFTVLASKQEGRSERASYTGGATREENLIADYDYIRGTYFFLDYPDRGGSDIPDDSVAVFFDDRVGSNNQNSRPGRAYVDPGSGDTSSVRGTFERLTPITDYQIQQYYGPFFKVIRLNRPVQDNHVLAVTYADRLRAPPTVGGGTEDDSVLVMKLLKAPGNLLPADATGRYDTGVPLVPTRDLELRNFYNLGGTRIDPQSLKLTIRRGTVEPPVTTFRTGDGRAIPYLQIVGLDNLDESSGTPVDGHDDKLDQALSSDSVARFVDYDAGILFFPDLRPFAPRTRPAGAPDSVVSSFEERIDALLLRDARLAYVDDTLGNAANWRIYDLRSPNRLYDSRYFINAEFAAAGIRSTIRLNRSNIVEGSESVAINGERLNRGADYDIDYDLGEIRLKRQPGPTDRLSIDYTYAPLFAQASKTLVGSAFRLEGRDRSVGGAFLYESRGAQELRPRLGEEPSRTLIGDFNTDLKFRPAWMTRLVDLLPGVRTTEPSSFNVNSEVGMSFPNPNTRNEVYIDDMEGVRDAVGLTMGFERWRLASIPPCPSCGVNGIQSQLTNAELHWYSPPTAVQERELKPRLTRAEGAENSHPVLALSIPRPPASFVSTDSLMWAGLTYPVDPSGYDLSGAQFIELWVNDFRDLDRIRNPRVKLHIDIGRVSEDQMRSPDRLPNGGGVPDTEDKSGDGQLNQGEDTGLDRALDGAETLALDLSTATGGDLSGDNWQAPGTDSGNKLDPGPWLRVNGTEGNSFANANPIPDTEDLDGNQILDTDEDFVRYTVDLGDTTFLVTDVYREFAGRPGVENPPSSSNGWRLFRIPLAAPSRQPFGQVDLKFTKHVRVWLEGVKRVDVGARPLLVLGGLEVVGSRWVAAGLDSIARATGTTLTLTSVNTIDNADVYTAPFDPGTTVSGSQSLKRREQSLALQVEKLPQRGKAECYRTFSVDEDYTRYNELRLWVTGYGQAANGLQYYLRFGADSTNYYEYRSFVPPIPANDSLAWREVKLKLTDISNAKLEPTYRPGLPDTVVGPAPGDTFILVGRPSFTRVRRITFGIRNPGGATVPQSQVWLNEIRAHGVAKDRGVAQRVLVNGRLANLMSYNFSWNGEDADFLRLGQARGSGSANNQYNASGTLDLHRFIEGTGIVLPVSLGWARNTRQPRFAAGDDILRLGEARERSSSLGESRSFGIRFSRAWSERSNPFLRHTIGGVTSSYSHQDNFSRSPTTIDNSQSSASAVSYGVSPRNLLSLKVPFTKTRFYPLPDKFYWNYAVTSSESRSLERAQDGSGNTFPRSRNKGRSARVDFGMDSRPFEFFRHHFDAARNLSLRPELMERVGFINFGKVVSWRQNMSLQVPVKRGPWLSPSIGWNSSYAQNNGPELSPDLSVRAVNNLHSVNLTYEMPFDRLRPDPGRVAARDTGAAKGADWLGVTLGRLGSVTTDLGYSRQSAYSRLRGTPSFFYLVGLSDDPGLGDAAGKRVVPAFGHQENKSDEWHARANSRFALFFGSMVLSRFEFIARGQEVNGAPSKNHNMRFPDLELDYGQVPKKLRLERWFRDPRLKTSFSRSTLTDFATGDRVTGRSSSSDWRPLLGLTGNLKNNTRTDLRVERRVSRRENLLFGQSVTTDRNTDVNLNLSRSYESGQKVSFLGKERTVRSTVTLGLSGVYSRRSGETLRKDIPNAPPQLVTRTDRLSLNATGSYNFSSNLSGQASLGFGQNRDLRDKEHPVVNRSIRLEVSASFTF